MKNGKPMVAIVHDWLVAYAGADRVVDCMHHVFPDAPIYTLVYDENNMPAWFKNYDIRTSKSCLLPPSCTVPCCRGCPARLKHWIFRNTIWSFRPALPAARA